jgi:hypothetical protein
MENSGTTSPPTELFDSPAATAALRDVKDALEVASAEGGGVPLPLAPDFAEVMSQVRTVLTVTEIAGVTGVK